MGVVPTAFDSKHLGYDLNPPVSQMMATRRELLWVDSFLTELPNVAERLLNPHGESDSATPTWRPFGCHGRASVSRDQMERALQATGANRNSGSGEFPLLVPAPRAILTL